MPLRGTEIRKWGYSGRPMSQQRAAAAACDCSLARSLSVKFHSRVDVVTPAQLVRAMGLTLALAWASLGATFCSAKDYFFTIAGGYSPEGNQASLEANVLFFQNVLEQEHLANRAVSTFFSDGYDDEPDLQILASATSSERPATDLLKNLHRRGPPRSEVSYRNHQVPNVAGPLKPDSIRASLRRQAHSMNSGDRLFIYVTAHGSSAKGDNRHNTTISCWDKESISARQFEGWLDEVPGDVPVIMVMAQCYCGGFAHTIFDRADQNNELSRHLRIGFFAQQHDLAAAGCRPDIKNDKEYSSYFWGAIAGRTRNGATVDSADLNGDRRVSLLEAHTYAMINSETIDIPLTASEALLRRFSRIGGGYDHRRDQPRGRNKRTENSIRPDSDAEAEQEQSTEDGDGIFPPSRSEPALMAMEGTLRDVYLLGEPEHQHVIAQLAAQLDLDLDGPVTDVFEAFASRTRRGASRGRGRRGRGRWGSGRRDLLTQIAERYPELADRDSWRQSGLLAGESQVSLFEEFEQLPAYKEYQRTLERFREFAEARERAETKSVKFQRLINTLESILLSQNLAAVADKQVAMKYQAMRALERSFLSPNANTGKALPAF